MSVPIPCPRCGADHLHGAVYVDAEPGDRFEIVGDGQEDETVVVRLDPAGEIKRPSEAHLLCCACDWEADRVVRWEADRPA